MILTVAGFDPSSGAGVTADLKTFAAHHCYGVAAITALTVQNTRGVQAVHPVDASILRDCLQSLMADGQVRAVKIGMLANLANAQAVGDLLKDHPGLPAILDPVLRSSSGAPLLDEEGFEFLSGHLLGHVTLVTPNLEEACALTGLKVENVEDMKTAARRLLDLGARAVVVTGGHLEKAVDVFADAATLEVFAGERVKTDNTHGTGCAFSSAVAANIAGGRRLPEAVVLAKAYVAESIKKSQPIGPGRVPLNHFYRTEESPRSGDPGASHSEAGS